MSRIDPLERSVLKKSFSKKYHSRPLEYQFSPALSHSPPSLANGWWEGQHAPSPSSTGLAGVRKNLAALALVTSTFSSPLKMSCRPVQLHDEELARFLVVQVEADLRDTTDSSSHRMSTTLGRGASGRPCHRPRRRAHLGRQARPFLIFRVFPPLLCDLAKGIIYIVDFRSRRICRAEEIVKGPTRWKWIPLCVHEVGRVVHPLFLLVRYHIDFFRSSDVYP
jgi:hypothetical protein